MPIFSKKTSILSKLHYIIGQKSQYNTLFSDSMKNYCSHTHIFSKNNQFYKKTLMFFFYMKKRRLSRPYLVKNRKFCQNYPILWAKKVNRMHFFPILHEKISALMPIFCQKNVHSVKTQCFFAHILSTKPPSCQKHVTLMSYF